MLGIKRSEEGFPKQFSITLLPSLISFLIYDYQSYSLLQNLKYRKIEETNDPFSKFFCYYKGSGGEYPLMYVFGH